jgi:alkanesulfonate monooxygenase SsuD/methylene tetrahydromethanopterin reductase-like flavin-dependent oxidoreductase (luciferase family)
VQQADGDPLSVKLGALLWTERTTWAELLRAAVALDRADFDSIWCSDHLFAATGDWRDSCFEAWTALSAIAASTARARVGLLVGAVGLRNPGLVAKQAATLDHVSDGRFVLGLGSGWLEREYSAHGFDWEPSAAARVDRLSEAIAAIRSLLRGEVLEGAGRFYRFDGAQHAPRPVQSDIPILIGGEGRRKTLRAVAEHADMWNARGPVAKLREADAALVEHCLALDRDPRSIERLTNRWIVIRGSRAQAERDLRTSLAGHGITEYDEGICALGPAPAAAEQLAATVSAGFRHLVLSIRHPFDYATIEAAGEIRGLLEAG